MFPSQDSSNPQDGGDLEQRLRGLILSNSTQDLGLAPGQVPLATKSLPPHMQTATPAAQNTGPAVHELSKAPEQTGKKRLNQAQRRQMNANLSIPIDPRPTQENQSGRGVNSYPSNVQQPRVSPQYGYPQAPQNQRYHQQQQTYSPRFPGQGQASPYSPRGTYPQISQSPHQPGHNQAPQPWQGPNTYQQQSPEFRNPASPYGRPPPPQNRQLFQPNSYSGQGRGRPFGNSSEQVSIQSTYLTKLLLEIVPTVGIEDDEVSEKDTFRAFVENACREAIGQHEKEELSNPTFDGSTVELKCFGSMSSGFATKASDMDLALLTPLSKPAADSSESPIPRLLERKLLDLGYGARLLTRTRVPIIKLCQQPTQKLLSDLLEARKKWEEGFVEGDESGAVDIANPEEGVESPKEAAFPSPVPSSVEATPQKPAFKEDPLTKLKQKEGQSLGDYYNAAKRLLRKLGGRDMSASSPSLKEEEGRILNDVCKAFIAGLVSDTLVSRLRSYQSISHMFDSSLPTLQRSLSGIWTQIEGERWAMAFQDRPLTEPHGPREVDCMALVEDWRTLQDACGPQTDPLAYNRLLFISAEKLKHFSSLQLVFLGQIEYEEPVYYQRRAQKILDDLKGRDYQHWTTVIPIVIAHYISGVHNSQIREQLQLLAQRDTNLSGNDLQNQTLLHIQKATNLNRVGLHHRALQLAVDYEHALKKGIFNEEDQPYVEQYISLLRSRTLDGPATTTDADAELLAKMRTLPDPTAISVNRPRDRYRDHLEFPKTDIGIQCDINFSADLALHNTLLLRCYSHSDHRVKLLILFIKHWAKVRGINTPYRGSLSSYGYVLMVLHYLVNVAQPFVCPNLQLLHKDPPAHLPPAEILARTTCNGRDVRFWRNEVEIKGLSSRGLLNHNKDSVGTLLRGFFEYYANNGQMSTVQFRGFDWGREVLSLRTAGGLLTKQEKGWVGARTVTETTTISAPSTPATPAHPKDNVEGELGGETEAKPKPKTVEETKEIRHRYLFAIEDPFELDHNVARTVTHNGIVSIRDEFRRAWKIIQDLGNGKKTDGLLDPVVNEDAKSGLQELFDLIHGVERK